MLWSSVHRMASAIASTPRQFAAVSCFSAIKKNRHKKESGRLIKTRTKQAVQTFIKGYTEAQKQTKQLQEAQNHSLVGSMFALDLRENKYNNSKQLRGQTTRGIDRSQPKHEVEDIRERDVGLAGPL